MKKSILPVFCLLFSIGVAAQTHAFRFFPVNDKLASYQGIVGKVGSRLFLLNRFNPMGLEVYVYDTLAQTGAQHVFRFPRNLTTTMTREHSVAFVGTFWEDNKLHYRYLEIGENGDSLHSHSDILGLNTIRNSSTTSPDKNHLLYYQFVRFEGDSALLHGTMIGSTGKIEKTLSYTFKHDKERDDEPTLFLDNAGNTHVLVYDKFDNYRLSTDLTINTIPLAEEAMISESFALRKTKLKTMRIFQDTVDNSLNAQGLFVDGQDRMVKGIYSFAFPQDRKNQLRPKYAAFTKDMVNSFRKGFNTRAAEVGNNLMLMNMAYTDSGTYAVFRLVSQQSTIVGSRSGLRNNIPEVFVSQGKVLVRGNNWNAPKLVYVRINRNRDFDWHATRGQDIFRATDGRFNSIIFGSDHSDFMTLLYEADRHDDPQPVLISFRNGKQVTEALPAKEMVFTGLHSLSHKTFAALYQNLGTGESGILLIHPADKQL